MNLYLFDPFQALPREFQNGVCVDYNLVGGTNPRRFYNHQLTNSVPPWFKENVAL